MFESCMCVGVSNLCVVYVFAFALCGGIEHPYMGKSSHSLLTINASHLEG